MHGTPLELHEDVVPDFDIVWIVAVDALCGHLREVFAEVDGDLRTRATRTSVGHDPEIVFFAEAQDAIGRGARFDPHCGCVFVGGDLLVALIDREPEALDRQFKDFGQKLPRHWDGFGFEVITERKVAQHFEERMMARGWTDFFEVVVFARDAQTLLCGGGTGVWALFEAKEGVFELHHS